MARRPKSRALKMLSGRAFLDTLSLIASNEQSIECEIRTLLEREKTLDRYDTVKVFYRCLEREDQMGCQIGMILS